MKHFVRQVVTFVLQPILTEESRQRRAIRILIFVALYIGVYATAHFLGPLATVYISVNYFLITLAGTGFGFWGAFICGSVSTITLGPLLPLFIQPPAFQTIGDSVLRMVLQFLFGILSGVLAEFLHREIRIVRDTTERFLQAQKMEAIGRLTGGVSHDFNNMLTVIGGYAEILQENSKNDPNLGSIAGEIRTAVQRAASLTHQLLAISRRSVMKPRRLNLTEEIQSLVKMLRRLIGDDVVLELLLAEGSWELNIDPSQVNQVLMNLAVNARDAMPNGGTLSIKTENVTADSAFLAQRPQLEKGDYVLITVTDTGSGIAPEVACHVLEPFFTTKERGKGTGLGLSTSYGIVRQLGGDMWFYSNVGKGTTFKICLPRATEADDNQTSKSRQGCLPEAECNATVLLAEDEGAVRKIVLSVLTSAGYRVISAEDGEQALSLLERYSEKIDLVLTDVVMPGLSGAELAEVVHEKYPQMAVVFTSGYPYGPNVDGKDLPRVDRFIEKPFTASALLEAVSEVLAK